jgi:hypothetical protein
MVLPGFVIVFSLMNPRIMRILAKQRGDEDGGQRWAGGRVQEGILVEMAGVAGGSMWSR